MAGVAVRGAGCFRRDALGALGTAGEERLSAAGRRGRADAGGTGAGRGLCGDEDDLTRRARQWIAAHLSEDFSLEDICAALYVSKGHLCRKFKKSTDDTVMGYVETQRMEKAEALLRRRRCSYAQLAAQVGYKDSHYFSKVFHKYMERRVAQSGGAEEPRHG